MKNNKFRKINIKQFFFRNGKCIDERGWDDIMFLKQMKETQGEKITIEFLYRNLLDNRASFRPTWLSMLKYLNLDFINYHNAKEVATIIVKSL